MKPDDHAFVPLPPERGTRDPQTATAGGEFTATAIEGVVMRPATTLPDPRGEVVELLTEAWTDVGGDRMVHAYAVTLEPGFVKGWVCHKHQSDRTVSLLGRLRWVLYDGRADSATCGLVQQLTFTERNRHLLLVPPGVWHAAENVGTVEAMFVNLPTHPYRHEDPDKYRLPLDTPEIPFTFPRRR
jgi:dTDP-4-dehydrorhamnose 3,5-epimerase